MKPDEKYMPSNYRNSDDDLNFMPFMAPYPLTLPKLEVKSNMNMQPPNLYPNPNNIGHNQTIDLNPNSMSYGETISTYDNKKNNTNSNLINNQNSEQNKLVSEQFPNYDSSDILYSYNNPSSNNTTNTNSTTQSSNRNPAELLRDLNLNLDEDIDLMRCCKDNDISKLYKEIEDDCPGILSLLEAYNIPSPIAKLIIRRIIKITMRYCKK